MAFYEALGCRRSRSFEDWVRLDRCGARLALQADTHVAAGPHYFAPHIHRHPRGVGAEVAIDVDDLDELHQQALTLDGAVVKGIQDRAWGARDFRIADPDGYFVRFTTPLGEIGE